MSRKLFFLEEMVEHWNGQFHRGSIAKAQETSEIVSSPVSHCGEGRPDRLETLEDGTHFDGAWGTPTMTHVWLKEIKQGWMSGKAKGGVHGVEGVQKARRPRRVLILRT